MAGPGLVLLPLALYAGWLSVAIFANGAEVLRAYGSPVFEAVPVAWSVAARLAAGTVAVRWLARARYALGYGAAMVWALVGIAVANVTRGLSSLVAVIAVVLAFVLTVITVAGRRRQNGRATSSGARRHRGNVGANDKGE